MLPGPAFVCAACKRSPGILKINRTIAPLLHLQLHRGALVSTHAQGWSRASVALHHARLSRPEPLSGDDPSPLPLRSILTDIPDRRGKSLPDDACEGAARQNEGLWDWGFDICEDSLPRWLFY